MNNVEEHHTPREREYRNISERYGDDVPVCIEDYRDLHPTGVFEVRSDGIYETMHGYAERIATPIEEGDKP